MSTRLAYSPAEAAEKVGLSESTIKRAINAGLLRAKKNGRRYLITEEQLREWLSELPDA